MTFNKKYYLNGQEVNETVRATFSYCQMELENLFQSSDEVARYEEMRMSDGRMSVSVKGRSNKILVQYKQMKT